MELTAENIKFIELSADKSSDKAIEKILPIVDKKIESHLTACKLAQLEAQQKKDSIETVNLSKWAAVIPFVFKNWFAVLVVVVLIYNRFSTKPVTQAEIMQTGQQISQIEKQIQSFSQQLRSLTDPNQKGLLQ